MAEHRLIPLAAEDVEGAVSRVIQARRARADYFGPELFSDPAWDILLLLFQAGLRGEAMTAPRLAEAIVMRATTVSRWIDLLEQNGLVQRKARPAPANALIELTTRGFAAMHQWVEHMTADGNDNRRGRVTDLLNRIYGRTT